MTTIADAGAATEVNETEIVRLVDELLNEHPPSSTDARTFLGAQFDRGLAWVHFEPGCGGLGGIHSRTVDPTRRRQDSDHRR